MRLSILRSVSFGLLMLGLVAQEPPSRAIGVAEVVKAFCLSAYQADLKSQGKTIPLVQIDRTCGCVGDRVAQGSDVEDAHDACGRPPRELSSGAQAGYPSKAEADVVDRG